jgi:putative ABC transport system permease protein
MVETFLALLRREEERRGFLGRVAVWWVGGWDALLSGFAQRIRGHSDRKGPREGGVDMLGNSWRDIRLAFRALGRRPLFAATVVLTLALGIGANTSVFTIVDGLLLTPLPYEDPEELVTLWAENPVLGWERTDVNPADAWDWRERSRSLNDLSVFHETRMSLTGEGEPELVAGVRATPNLLGLLGVQPARGRDLSDLEMGPGRDDVLILSDGFWRRRFGGDPGVLGSTLTLDGKAHTVIGILPPAFRFLDLRPDVFLPLNLIPAQATRGGHYAEALGRLATGVTLDEARRELRQIAAQLQEEHPESNEDWTVSVVSTHGDLVGDTARRASLVLLVAVGFVLLMVCVNVANLFLAQGECRTRELAIRTALGAGRGRIIGQLFTESLILALLGGGLGLALASWGYRGIVAALPSNTPPVFEFGLNVTVLTFTLAVTVAAALMVGVLPALRSTRAETSVLRDGGRIGQSPGSARFGSLLVVFQTATAVVLLVGGGLLMKSISSMRNQDFGFDPLDVLTFRLAPPEAEYPGDPDLRTFWEAVGGSIREVPGVVAVGNTQSHPLMGSNWGGTIRIAGEEEERRVRLTYLSGGAFEALRFRMVAGRPIRASDRAGDPMVAVVNETFVRRYLRRSVDPLSASILRGEETLPPIPIVGVIRDVVERSVDAPPEPALYLSADQGVTRARSLVIRTSGPPERFTGRIQEAVWSVDPKLPLFEIETMEALVERRVGGFAVIGYLMGIFALLALFLGTLGIYGVTAFSAGRRRGEIGIRMALGAEPGDVVRMVVKEGARRALLGLFLGLALAFLVSGAMGGILVGVDARDPGVFAGVVLVLASASLLGLWLPARRAAAGDPVRALGAE